MDLTESKCSKACGENEYSTINVSKPFVFELGPCGYSWLNYFKAGILTTEVPRPTGKRLSGYCSPYPLEMTLRPRCFVCLGLIFHYLPLPQKDGINYGQQHNF